MGGGTGEEDGLPLGGGGNADGQTKKFLKRLERDCHSSFRGGE